MVIHGLRCFGKNEGYLNHTGDFVLLFEPLLPILARFSVYGPDIYFPFLYEMDPDEAQQKEYSPKSDGILEEQDPTRSSPGDPDPHPRRTGRP